MNARRAAAGLALLALAACGTPGSRIKAHKELFASYPPEAQARIKAGEVDVGFTGDMVRLAMGEPARKVMRTTAQSVQEDWVYGDTGVHPGVGFAVGGGGMGGFGTVAVGGDGSSGPRAVIVFEGGKVIAVEKSRR
jgi:hypothetical protein